MLTVSETTFEPAIHSIAELRFLLDHLEEPPHAALHDATPAGVNPTQITKTLTVLQELDQLQKFRGVPWAGFEAVKDSILRFLAWQERCQEIFRLTGGAAGQRSVPQASQYGWDESGNAYKYAIGADSAEMVRTEILDNGDRKSFTVKLLVPEGARTEELASVAPWLAAEKQTRALDKDEVKEAIDKKKKHGSFTCTICLKAEQFDLASRASRMAARARMGSHLKRASTEVARHRLLYRKVFESPSAKA